MVDKPFLLFGKKKLSKVDLKEQQLAALEARIGELKREKEGLTKESAKIIEEAEKKVRAVEKEEKALKSLRNAVSIHSGHVDKKESELGEKEKFLDKEALRLQKLQQEEAGLRGEIAKLDKSYSEKSSALNKFKSEVSESRREKEKLRAESSRIIEDAEKKVLSAEKEEKALKSFSAVIAKHKSSLDNKESELEEREKLLSKDAVRIQKLLQEEAGLRQSIGNLEKFHDEKVSALGALKNEASSLSREVSNLKQRRAEYAKLEDGIRNLSLKERQIRQEMSRIEQRVAEGAKMVSGMQEDKGHFEKRLKELQSGVQLAAALKKQLEKENSAHKKSILSSERDLADMEDAVKSAIDAKDELQQKAVFLSKRERQVEEQERRIEQKRAELIGLSESASSVQQSRQELIALVEEKKHVLADLKSSINENSSTIEALHEREKSAKKAEAGLTVAERDADKKLKLLASKEKDLITRETAIVEHEKSLKEALSMLAKEKLSFGDEVTARKAEFLLIQQEWDKKFASLSDEKRELRSEKTDVRKLVESDILALKDKEDELVQTIVMLEKDKKKLQEEETAVMRRVRELEREKIVVEREKNALSSKEKKITDGERIIQKGTKFIEVEKRKIEDARDVVFRGREFKRMIPKMEKRYNELNRSVRMLEAHAMEEGTRPSVSRVLKEREKDVAMKEKGIEFGVRRLVEREHEVEELEARKEKAFSEYLREEVERAQMGKPGKELANPDIHAMLDDAREKIMRGDLDAAIRTVSQAELLIERLNNQDHKRTLMYDVRDLKASIKLASLT